jgi:hypothetical protein
MATAESEIFSLHYQEDVEDLRKLTYRSLDDPRIINYFSRKYVKSVDVLELIDQDEIYEQCTRTKPFLGYVSKRKQVDALSNQVSMASGAGPVTWKSIFIAAGVIWLVFLTLSGIGPRLGDASVAALFTAFSLLIALAAGSLTRWHARARTLSLTVGLPIFLLLSLSICSITLPLVFALFPWRPVGAYVGVVVAFVIGALLSKETVTGVYDLGSLIKQAGVCVIEWPSRRASRKNWLDHSLANIIYPSTVLAINEVLGEDSPKLLVEQDSDGLRRLQDPKLTIPTKSEYQLRNLLKQMDGGSIAVTGPRGAGKSTLLREICTTQGVYAIPPSIYVSAPAEYVARDFLAELFQEICDRYLERLGSPIAEMRYGGYHTHQDAFRVIRLAMAFLKIILRAAFALSLLIIVLWPFLAKFHLSVFSDLPARRWYSEMAPQVISLWDKYAWDKHHVAVRFCIFALALMVWPYGWVRRRWLEGLRRPDSVRQARSYSIHLKIERTSSWGANVSLPTVRSFGLSLNKGKSDKYAPWSLPELVSKLRDFIEVISRTGGLTTGPMIISIDEIDRIGSVEQAERFIGEIKSIFGIPNCFFLVSVAEDVGFLFSRQSILGQSALEHAFDDVVVVDALEFDEARDLLSARVPGFTDSFVFLALALSGGLPREMIRVARRLVDVNHRETKEDFFPRIGDLAVRLVAEDSAEVLRTSRSQLARMSLPESWGAIFHQLRVAMALLGSEKTRPKEYRKIISDLCSLRTPSPADSGTNQVENESSAAKVINGLVAFAYYSITVIEAFDNDYFDLRTVRKRARDATGSSYMELAAARMELGISPESSEATVRRFRTRAGLPEVFDSPPSRSAEIG